MLTYVYEHVDISHNVKSDFKSPCLNSVSGISFFCQMNQNQMNQNLKSKSEKVKSECSVHPFRTALFFQMPSHSIEKRLKLKCSAGQILAMKSDFVSLHLLWVAIRSFPNN